MYVCMYAVVYVDMRQGKGRHSQNVSFPTLTLIINHSIAAPVKKNIGRVLYTPSLCHHDIRKRTEQEI